MQAPLAAEREGVRQATSNRLGAPKEPRTGNCRGATGQDYHRCRTDVDLFTEIGESRTVSEALLLTDTKLHFGEPLVDLCHVQKVAANDHGANVSNVRDVGQEIRVEQHDELAGRERRWDQGSPKPVNAPA